VVSFGPSPSKYFTGGSSGNFAQKLFVIFPTVPHPLKLIRVRQNSIFFMFLLKLFFQRLGFGLLDFTLLCAFPSQVREKGRSGL
jgi:hypothetical protein